MADGVETIEGYTWRIRKDPGGRYVGTCKRDGLCAALEADSYAELRELIAEAHWMMEIRAERARIAAECRRRAREYYPTSNALIEFADWLEAET